MLIIKKTNRPTPSEEQIDKAINEMNNNTGINYQTLHNRINSKHTKCDGRDPQN